MPKLKRLSGKDVAGILSSFGFHILSQRGSHIKLLRTSTRGNREILTVPMHSELDKGTIKAIMRQASRYIPEDELRLHFYSK